MNVINNKELLGKNTRLCQSNRKMTTGVQYVNKSLHLPQLFNHMKCWFYLFFKLSISLNFFTNNLIGLLELSMDLKKC